MTNLTGKTSSSGIIRSPTTGESVVPSSVRADGSLRKEIKIRPGYIPVEDVNKYTPPRRRAVLPPWMDSQEPDEPISPMQLQQQPQQQRPHPTESYENELVTNTKSLSIGDNAKTTESVVSTTATSDEPIQKPTVPQPTMTTKISDDVNFDINESFSFFDEDEEIEIDHTIHGTPQVVKKAQDSLSPDIQQISPEPPQPVRSRQASPSPPEKIQDSKVVAEPKSPPKSSEPKTETEPRQDRQQPSPSSPPAESQVKSAGARRDFKIGVDNVGLAGITPGKVTESNFNKEEFGKLPSLASSRWANEPPTTSSSSSSSPPPPRKTHNKSDGIPSWKRYVSTHHDNNSRPTSSWDRDRYKTMGESRWGNGGWNTNNHSREGSWGSRSRRNGKEMGSQWHKSSGKNGDPDPHLQDTSNDSEPKERLNLELAADDKKT